MTRDVRIAKFATAYHQAARRDHWRRIANALAEKTHGPKKSA